MNTTNGRLFERASNYFRIVAAMLLLIVGLAKVASGFSSKPVFTVTDPLFGLPFKTMMFGVGSIEILIAWVCFSSFKRVAFYLIAWFATMLLVYRLGLSWIDWHQPCACMGTLTDVIKISPAKADSIMKLILGFLLIGSYLILIFGKKQSKNLPVEVPTGPSNASENHGGHPQRM